MTTEKPLDEEWQERVYNGEINPSALDSPLDMSVSKYEMAVIWYEVHKSHFKAALILYIKYSCQII